LAKYLSSSSRVKVVSGIPRNLSFPEGEKRLDIGTADLVEIPGISLKTKINSNQSTGSASRGFLKRFGRGVLIPFVPLAEFLFPLSSGGIIWHNQKAFENQLRTEIENEKDLVIFSSFGPWFPIKLAMKLKREFPQKIFWVADFRDQPFSNPHFLLTHLPLFKWYAKRVFQRADLVTVTNFAMEKDFKKLTPDGNFLFLPNGFDPQDFPKEPVGQKRFFTEGRIKISYTGSFYPNGGVKITPFVKVLKRIKEQNPMVFKSIQFAYAGKDSNYVRNQLENARVGECLNDLGQVTRERSMKLQMESDLLLLIPYTGSRKLGSGQRSGKIYEYFASGNPIMVIGVKEWELRETLEKNPESGIFGVDEIQEMASFLVKKWENREKGYEKMPSGWVDEFEYPRIAQKMLECVKMTQKKPQRIEKE